MRWAITVLSIVTLAWVGWNLGMAATDRPHTSLPGGPPSIHAWVADPESVLRFTWWTSPSGTVDVIVFLEHPETEETQVVLLLQCNARFREYEDLSYRAEVSVQNEVGDPDACDPRLGDPREAPAQIITLTFCEADPGSDFCGRAQLRGTSYAQWSDEAAGERVSHGPSVTVGGPTPSAYFDAEPFHEPGSASITTTLYGAATEVLESHFPTEVRLGIGASGGVTSAVEPSVSWHTDWSAEKMRSGGWRFPLTSHTSATAHWSDAAAVAQAQQWLLLSGVFLASWAPLSSRGSSRGRRVGRTSARVSQTRLVATPSMSSRSAPRPSRRGRRSSVSSGRAESRRASQILKEAPASSRLNSTGHTSDSHPR